MNSLMQVILLATSVILGVKCICRYPSLNDLTADRKCVLQRNQAMANYTEEELIQLTQNNLNLGQQLVMQRSETARAMGLDCYYEFNTAYTAGIRKIMGTDAEMSRLSTATSDGQRLEAVRALAEMTNFMICDENGFRRKHANDSVECLMYEKIEISAEIVLDFGGIDGMVTIAKIYENIKNPIVGKVVADIDSLYKQLFRESQECVKAIAGTQYCRNVKVFKWEWCRHYDLLFLKPML